MGVDDGPAVIFVPDFFDVGVDYLFLELGGGGDRFAIVTASVIFKYG